MSDPTEVKLSIICPTFNRASMLRDAIKSTFQNGTTDWEFIIVDDASDDNTAATANELIWQNRGTHLIRYIRQEHRGAPHARNRGLQDASGRLVMFMDSDDIAVPTGISELIKAIESHDLDYAYGRVAHTDGHLQPIANTPDVGEPFTSNGNGIVSLSWHTMGAVYKKAFLTSKVGDWNVNLTGSQDWEFQARVKLADGSHAFIDTLVGLWRLHDGPRIGAGNFSHTYVQSVLAACLSIEESALKAGKADDALRVRLARRLINHMFEASANGDSELAQRIGVQARRLSAGHPPEKLLSLLSLLLPAKFVARFFLNRIRQR